MSSRRGVLVGLGTLAVVAGMRSSIAAEGSRVVVSKDPNCGCCSGWVQHLRSEGFAVEVRDVPDVNRVRARLGVPADLAGCHTAQVAGYVIEGHVPASALRRFLSEKPKAKGLAVPGMPVGSPGMEVPNVPPDEYDVVLFGTQRRVYARFKGPVEIVQ